MFLKNLKKIAFLALTSFAVIPASAQDLLASQAPIDRTMKSIDSIALKSIIQKENSEVVLGANLYNEWSNQYTHKETVLPDSFLIDLRGFHMPTDRTNVTSNFGYRWRRQHKGIDVKVYIGDTIRSAFNGKVRIVKYDRRGYGKYVVIRHLRPHYRSHCLKCCLPFPRNVVLQMRDRHSSGQIQKADLF